MNHCAILSKKAFEVEIVLLHAHWAKRNAGRGTPATGMKKARCVCIVLCVFMCPCRLFLRVQFVEQRIQLLSVFIDTLLILSHSIQ